MGFDLGAFQKAYKADANSAVITEFWKTYDKNGWSLWRCTYDYPEDTENLDAAKEIVTSFITNCAALEGKCKCFGVMHTLSNHEIEGLWLLEGPDPEPLFGVNEDTSWFTWSQIGPDASDAVKTMVGQVWNAGKEYNGKEIKDTQSTWVLTSSGELSAPAPDAVASGGDGSGGVDLEALAKEITEAGEKVKELKTNKASEKADIDAAVKLLLEKKQQYADNNEGIGVDGKPFGGGKKKGGGGGGGGGQPQPQVRTFLTSSRREGNTV